jgi:5-methylcytosine-specific restriction protein A
LHHPEDSPQCPFETPLVLVGANYRRATTETFASHPLAAFIRGTAAREVEAGLGDSAQGLLVVGSAGAGNWAEVPWVSVFDPVVTDSATRGYYVVYLFHASSPVVHLSLNQGTTAVRDEFGPRAREILTDRAAFMRKRVGDFASYLPVETIELGSSARLPGDYAAGHAMGITYDLSDLPSETALRSDLQIAVQAYRGLTFRGGLDADIEAVSTDAGELPPGGSLIELRRYRLHSRIERNPDAARTAKKHHGLRCQVCDISFAEKYGPLGEGFIEAHHLRPMALLEEGKPISYNVAADFAVLCANCHRMIHRTADPSDVAGLRALFRANNTTPTPEPAE